ncbi:3-oxoacyl-ACP synthase III family protein [Neobacillus drentensis]|uniref:3-oxoacyl-ACP synthase III family protein n=1 Tax=Neobacillus drentensis TaxID=220684 RepID=UPI00082474C3|nr:3-oxoacyl-[acyl-carrier-protein] synthase III C-terminal domain-containing protein [Neobacillus drentensis]
MNLTFQNKKITGILTVLPKNEVKFDDEASNYNFPIEKSLRLKKIMGYNKHRIVDEETCVSDLCAFGLEHLIESNLLKKDEIDALILVTQTPDHFIPPTSNIIQGRLGLKQDMICMDINQGCAGYLLGLIQAFMLLDQDSIKKVVLLNADVLSRKTSSKDRNSYPLVGDAASVTIVERGVQNVPIYCNIKMDGSKANSLIIPAGGLRMPSTPETSELEDPGDSNLRSKNDLIMDGTSVFNFVQTEVPPMVSDLFEMSKVNKDDVDYFMFHQPNRFMLEKLADSMEISYEKMPNNVVTNFGNSSSVTIPTTITFNLGEQLQYRSYKICLAGFGAGLTWSSMMIELGNLDFCYIIEY